MSLTSFAFGNNPTDIYNNPHLWIETPADRAIRRGAGGEAVASVKKACKFVGGEGVYVIAKVSSGCLSQGMGGTIAGKYFKVVDIESKYGRAAKEGMSCGLTLSGVDLSDLHVGETLKFC